MIGQGKNFREFLSACEGQEWVAPGGQFLFIFFEFEATGVKD